MRQPAPLVVVGDALLDVDLDGTVERMCPDAPGAPVVDQPVERARPGGAGLAALLAAADGRVVTLVTALGRDDAGRRLRGLLDAAGVAVVDLGLDGDTPQKVRVRTEGRTLLRIDHGRPGGVPGAVTAEARTALAGAGAVLVADYGRGVAAAADVRAALVDVAVRTPLVWDPHPKGPAPVEGTWVATPNRAEAARFAPDAPGRGAADPAMGGVAAAVVAAEALRAAWPARAVVVTLGARGAVLVGEDGTPLAVPAEPVEGGDPCGAGDRFATALAAALADGALPSEAVATAVAVAGAFVAAGGAGAVPEPRVGPAVVRLLEPGAGPAPAPAPAVAASAPPLPADGGLGAAMAVIARVRGAGGTVVATGGCFDLLHAGHVAMLAAARRLGDCLVVCLNSDESVARRKGPDRPRVTAADRAAVLRSLAAVDAVAVFGEDTPEAILDVLRPDVWAKGADYTVDALPEARLLRSWGGRAVVLPFVPGRSTTALIEKGRTR